MVGCSGLAVVLALTTAAVAPRRLSGDHARAGSTRCSRWPFGAGANTTFILAVQGLRLLVAVLLAPLAVRRIARAGREPA